MTTPRRPILVVLIAFILALQSLALIGVAALFTFETITSASLSLAGSIFFDVLVWISAISAGAVTVGFWMGKSSTRAAVIVWQMLFVGIAIATGQGAEARPDVALIIGIPAALVATFLLFNRGVSRHFGVGA